MFKFKNISSKDMNVLIEEEDHFLAKAQQRVETITIDGKDGSTYNPLGYSNIKRPIKVQVLDNSKTDKVMAWLNGKGILEYKGRITEAYFYSEIEPIRSASIKIADFSFIRNPFWLKADDDFIVVTNEVINEGNIEARPIIRLEKQTEESIELTIGGVRFSYNFPEDEDYVEIDCEEMEAKYDGFIKNRNLQIGYEFPLLPVGESDVVIHFGDAIIEIKRKDRWL